MKQANIFEGESIAAQLANIIYRCLMTGEQVNYQKFLSQYLSKEQLKATSVANFPEYKEAKRALKAVMEALEAKCPGCIVTEGNNRNRYYRYTGTDKDPLEDLQSLAIVSDLKTYFKFCRDSAGLFPQSWLDHFFRYKTEQAALKPKQGVEPIIARDVVELLNIDYLPCIYDCICKKEPFQVMYHPFGKQEHLVTMHPHYLREHNGRWFVMGHVEGKTPKYGRILALDRMTSPVQSIKTVDYVPADKEAYQSILNHQIGITVNSKDPKIYKVRVRVYGDYFWGLVTTKKIHSSQHIVTQYAKHRGEEYGEVMLHVRLNKELIGRLLFYSGAIQVMQPDKLRKEMIESIQQLAERYKIK